MVHARHPSTLAQYRVAYSWAVLRSGKEAQHPPSQWTLHRSSHLKNGQAHVLLEYPTATTPNL